MDVLHSRAERLTAHLREGLRARRWKDPLPNSREWARQLGVSCTTLGRALAVLRKEGLVRIEPRQGVRLGQIPVRRRVPTHPKRLRVMRYGHDDLELTPLAPHLDMLLLRIQEHGIRLDIEDCPDERLRQICSTRPEPEAPCDDLTILNSVARKYQALLAKSKAPALLLGRTLEGLHLPYINPDYPGAVRHAAQRLLRRGFSKLCLLIQKSDCPGSYDMRHAFAAACKESPHQPIKWDIIPVRPHPKSESTAFLRLADHAPDRLGVIIVPPLSVAVLMTVLLGRGIAIPGRVEVAVVGSFPDSVRVYPRPTHYPFPSKLFVRAIVDIAVHYFESGVLPISARIIPMELAPGP